MLLKTLYLYELKKLFLSKVNLLALAGTVIMIVVLIISSNHNHIGFCTYENRLEWLIYRLLTGKAPYIR